MPDSQHVFFMNKDAIISAWEPLDNGSPHVATGTGRSSCTSPDRTWGIWGGFWESQFNTVWQSVEKLPGGKSSGSLEVQPWEWITGMVGSHPLLSTGWDRGPGEGTAPGGCGKGKNSSVAHRVCGRAGVAQTSGSTCQPQRLWIPKCKEGSQRVPWEEVCSNCRQTHITHLVLSAAAWLSDLPGPSQPHISVSSSKHIQLVRELGNTGCLCWSGAKLNQVWISLFYHRTLEWFKLQGDL